MCGPGAAREQPRSVWPRSGLGAAQQRLRSDAGVAQEWLRSVAQPEERPGERPRSGSGVAQEWLRSDQEWHRSVAQERPGSGPGVAQEWLRSGS